MDLISGLRAKAKETPASVRTDVASALSLEGRTAVVTGSAMGIGRQTAILFAHAGARVVLADRAAEGLEETAQLAEGALIVPTDVSLKSEVEDLARRAIRETGRIDVWANVAGIIRSSPIVDTTEEDLDSLIAVNLKGVYWGCSAAGRVMSIAGRGSIINVASAGGEVPAPNLSVYGLTKAAVIQLTRTAAAEFGPKGIRVNAVAPGFVETPMTSRHWTGPDGAVNEEMRKQVLGSLAGQSPLGTTGTPEDIAWAMLFLAADTSRFITGQVMRPNGGVYMG